MKGLFIKLKKSSDFSEDDMSSRFHLILQSFHNDCLTRYAVSRYTLADNGCCRKCLLVCTFSTLLQEEFSNTFCIPFHHAGLSVTFHDTYYFFSSYFQSRSMKLFPYYFTSAGLSILIFLPPKNPSSPSEYRPSPRSGLFLSIHSQGNFPVLRKV